MCGIAGFAGPLARRPDIADHLGRMCGAIRHRGPDDEGHFIAPGIALGMRRLSIIDVAGGHQPVSNENGSIQVVFNGEIYNHHLLRARLEQKGHVFRTRSDTEVIVHAYEEYGDACVREFRGMFAFALWDAAKSRLLLARDRLGIKPLYYWPAEGGLAFASELGSLLALDAFVPEIDPRAISGYLTFGYVPDPLAVFAGVHKLEPGHTLTWTQEDGFSTAQYWTAVRPESASMDAVEATRELRRLLIDAVESHLESEVPLGAFLSGGVDSSTVVALMARASSRKVRTFSIGFDEAGYNEAPHAAAVAAELGTDHTELVVRPDSDELIEIIVAGFDEPFADSSALPTYLVSRLAREHVTVTLSGDGGDELFGGYSRYAEVVSRQSMPAAPRRVLRTVGRALPHSAWGRNRILDLARTREGRYAATVASALSQNEGGVGLTSLPGSEEELEHLLRTRFAQSTGRDFVTRMTIVDMQTYLPGDILTKVDRMSMAVSLEARVPLLDHHLVEFAIGLPGTLKLKDGTGKWLFRQAIAGLVPDSVLTKPKQGFAVPLASWLRNALRHRVTALLRPASPIYQYVDRAAVVRLVAEHQRERRDHSHMLWRLLVLDLWLGAHVGRQTQPARHCRLQQR